MKRILPMFLPLLGAICAAVASSDICGATATVDGNTDLLVWFSPGGVAIPVANEWNALTQVTFNPANPGVELAALGAESVTKAFSAFGPADTIAVNEDGTTTRTADYSNVFRVRFPSGSNLDSTIASLVGIEGIWHAEKLLFPSFALTYANDSLFVAGKQWNLANFGQDGGTQGADVRAPNTWAITTGIDTVTIAEIDNGVTGIHEDLVGRIRLDGDQTWTATGTQPGHGFLVAGVMAANADNRRGIAGLDWHARILSGNVESLSTDQVATKLGTLASYFPAPKIFNSSVTFLDKIGEPATSWALGSAYADLYKRKRVLVAAMGNFDGSEVQYPAGYGKTSDFEGGGWGMIAVGATDHNDLIYSGSNTGAHVDVVAPGVGIWTTWPFSPGYAVVSGTSVSTPAVSALASLLLSKRPSLTNDDIERLIRYSADPLPGPSSTYGAGRINARRALELLSAPSILVTGTDSLVVDSSLVASFLPAKFVGVSHVADGQLYCTNRYRVDVYVSFPPNAFTNAAGIRVWGRGTEGVPGFSLDTVPNYGMGFWEVVPGSVTTSGCRMRTYVYEVTATGPNCVPAPTVWVPKRPTQIRCAWTALEMKSSGIPDPTTSYYVPQADVSGELKEGADAYKYFKTCPNNDGLTPFGNNARLKIVVRDAAGSPIPGVSAADIQLRFSGGTQAQGYSSEGSDSVIASGFWNPQFGCPDLYSIEGDADTDAGGLSYITLHGRPAQPGARTRDQSRKWGHYDSEVPVYVLGVKIPGHMTSGSGVPYVLQFKNVDWSGGLGAAQNVGEGVSSVDTNPVQNSVNKTVADGPIYWWMDFDGSGSVGSTDINFSFQHIGHNCATPLTP